ncbi:hypothetical protein NMT12_60125 [metagenome]
MGQKVNLLYLNIGWRIKKHQLIEKIQKILLKTSVNYPKIHKFKIKKKHSCFLYLP